MKKSNNEFCELYIKEVGLINHNNILNVYVHYKYKSKSNIQESEGHKTKIISKNKARVK